MISQLDLADAVQAFSARHLSFIETGRTQPSRQALLVLAGNNGRSLTGPKSIA